MSIRATLLKWLVPSTWVETINGSKTLLGLIALVLWAAIYAVPALGAQVQAFLISVGVNLSAELLNLGSILVLVGLADKIVDHKATKFVLGLLRLIEEPIAKLIDKGK